MAIDETAAVQIFENNVICTQNSRPQIFKFTNCFDPAAVNVSSVAAPVDDDTFSSRPFLERYLRWNDSTSGSCLATRYSLKPRHKHRRTHRSIAISGYNSTVLAYGQTASGNIARATPCSHRMFTLTSSGKSHSIFGSSSEEGILSLSIHDLITMNANHHLKFELSFLEIYNEKVTDLLAAPATSTDSANVKPSGKSSTSTSFSKQARTHILNKLVPSSNSANNTTRPLEIREHPLLGPYVPDLKYIQVKTKEDFQNVLNLGNQQRSVASTNANQRSSRSHAIFTVKISRVDVPSSTNMRLSFGTSTTSSSSAAGKSAALSSSSKKTAKQQAQDELDAQAVRLNFVDLAGSEKSQQYHGTLGKNDRFAVSQDGSCLCLLDWALGHRLQ